MYFNLKYIISGYISSKYHYYLRCVSDEWRTVSQLTTNIDQPIFITRDDFGDICKQGYRELILYTFKHAIEREIINDYLKRGLDSACEGDNLEIVKLMIEKIEKIVQNKYFAENTLNDALQIACQKGYLEIVKLIIDKCLNHNFCYIIKLLIYNNYYYWNIHWDCGLFYACRGGYLEIIQLMIEQGANNWDGGLEGACQGGHLEIVKLMIEKGADNLNRGLYLAYKGGHLEIFKFMINYRKRC